MKPNAGQNRQSGSAQRVSNITELDAEAKRGQIQLQRFKAFFQSLNIDTIENGALEQLYGPALVFEDSFHRIEGRQAFKDYCRNLYENVKHIQFVFHDEWCDHKQGMLTWTMTFSHSRIRRGRPIEVEGASHIRFDDQVIYHRDYFDGGALLYEHLPLLGGLIQQIKKRMN